MRTSYYVDTELVWHILKVESQYVPHAWVLHTSTNWYGMVCFVLPSMVWQTLHVITILERDDRCYSSEKSIRP